jgi:hypothetical protein
MSHVKEQQKSKQQEVIKSILKYAFGSSVPKNFWDEKKEINFPLMELEKKLKPSLDRKN